MSSLSPQAPRRQRKAAYEAHTARRRLLMTVPLSRELRRRFHQRSLPLRKGDTVRVMSGSFVGREERVAKIDRRRLSVTLDNVTLKTGESKLKPLPIRTSHLVLTKLNLADAWRRRTLQVREEDVTPEERGETVEAADELPSTPATPTLPAATSEATPEAPAPAEEETADDEPAPAPKPRSRKKAVPPTEESA